MKREEAEKLLGVLVFDELDEASKAELLAYLETDDELRERLADLRMAVKVTGDAINSEPEPVLSVRSLNRLAQLAQRPGARTWRITNITSKVVAAAAVLLIAGLIPFLAIRQTEFNAPGSMAKFASGDTARDLEKKLELNLNQLEQELAEMRATPGSERTDLLDEIQLTRQDLKSVREQFGDFDVSAADTQPQVSPEGPRPGLAPARHRFLFTEDAPAEPAAKIAAPIMPAPTADEERVEFDNLTTSGKDVVAYDTQFGGAPAAESMSLFKREALQSESTPVADGRESNSRWGRRLQPLAEFTDEAEPAPTPAFRSPSVQPQAAAEESSVARGYRLNTPDAPTEPTPLSVIDSGSTDERGRTARGLAQQAPRGGRGETRRRGGAGTNRSKEAVVFEDSLDRSAVERHDDLYWRAPTLGDRPKSDPQRASEMALGPMPGDGTSASPSEAKKLTAAKSEAQGLVRDGLSSGVTPRASGAVENETSFGIVQTESQNSGVIAIDGENADRSLAIAEDRLPALETVEESGAMYGGGLGGGGTVSDKNIDGIVAQDLPSAEPKLRAADEVQRNKSIQEDDAFFYGWFDSKQEVADLADKTQLQQQWAFSDPSPLAEAEELAEAARPAARPQGSAGLETPLARKPQSGTAGDLNGALALSESIVTPPVTGEVARELQAKERRLSELSAEIEARQDLDVLSTGQASARVSEDLKSGVHLETEVRFGREQAKALTDSLAMEDLSLSVTAPVDSESNRFKAKARTDEDVEKRLAPVTRESLRQEALGRVVSRDAGAPAAQEDFAVPELEETLQQVQDLTATLGEEGETLNKLSVEWDESEAKRPVAGTSSDYLTVLPSAPMPPGEDVELPPSAGFKSVPVNPWVLSAQDRLSTFGLDVDTASYTLCRRYIRAGYRPPIGAVRMEEFVNAFDYNYPQRHNATFAIHAQAAKSPFARPGQDLTLLKVGVKARTVGRDQHKPAHLVIVVDASASMGQVDRLPLVQRGLDRLLDSLSAADRVTVIACADEAYLHQEAVSAEKPARIRAAIHAIQPAGTTNLISGLELGYATARRHFRPGQVNHVLLCSDGVANVGPTEADALLASVEADRKQGITLTCVGVGFGSYNDTLLEALANRGDGNYLFLDAADQVEEVLVAPLTASLQGVAKDARIQIAFDPQRVRRYRLIGYENRDIEDKRFRDDTVDAAEVGSGQCSTALYEVELIGDPQADLGKVFVRYQDVDSGQFQEISTTLSSRILRTTEVKEAPRFYLAAGAATFAEWLRQSEHVRHVKLADVLRVMEEVRETLTLDSQVAELVELIRRAEHLPQAP